MITTPIFYVNAQPHIGHLFTSLLADACSRWHGLKGKETHFVTGTDEHGQKVEASAQALGKDPLQFCDEISSTFKDVC